MGASSERNPQSFGITTSNLNNLSMNNNQNLMSNQLIPPQHNSQVSHFKKRLSHLQAPLAIQNANSGQNSTQFPPISSTATNKDQ
jgi:hypothetical protein